MEENRACRHSFIPGQWLLQLLQSDASARGRWALPWSGGCENLARTRRLLYRVRSCRQEQYIPTDAARTRQVGSDHGSTRHVDRSNLWVRQGARTDFKRSVDPDEQRIGAVKRLSVYPVLAHQPFPLVTIALFQNVNQRLYD